MRYSDNKEFSFRNLNFFSDRINWTEVQNELAEVNWNEIDSASCATLPDRLLETIYSQCQKVCVKHIPTKRERTKKNIILRDRRIQYSCESDPKS